MLLSVRIWISIHLSYSGAHVGCRNGTSTLPHRRLLYMLAAGRLTVPACVCAFNLSCQMRCSRWTVCCACFAHRLPIARALLQPDVQHELDPCTKERVAALSVDRRCAWIPKRGSKKKPFGTASVRRRCRLTLACPFCLFVCFPPIRRDGTDRRRVRAAFRGRMAVWAEQQSVRRTMYGKAYPTALAVQLPLAIRRPAQRPTRPP